MFSSPAHIATLPQAHLQPTLNQRRVTVCLTVGELTSDLKSCPSISDKSECSGPIQSIPLPCPALRPTSSAASESGGTDARRTPPPRHPGPSCSDACDAGVLNTHMTRLPCSPTLSSA